MSPAADRVPRSVFISSARDSVLQARQVGYHINRHGLRESGALSAARIFALGDSYVFGFATDETAIWPKVLERTIGQPVYNLGVSDSGPRQQVQLLEHLLRLHADSMHVEHLLWMIFEGNDLENSYQELRSAASTARQADGSFALALTGLPRLLREHSVIHALLIGGLTVRRGHDATKEVEGVVLRNPLYHSVRWGYRLFNPYDIQTVRRGAQYVQSHPNAPALAATVREMTKLSEKMGFRVTVILAPTDARLYGRSFEGMPALSETPYFLDHFGSLAAQSGFSVVDLSRLMASYAERELLYYRDDHHWNARGNAIAAQLIAQSIEF